MPNHLINETSPYLQQHANNPVDWYPWSEAALQRARDEDKPIFLSIGYSSCHWCHVMAHESFEDLETAAIMNEHYVNIKVDREERPDLDAIYMQAVVAMTGSGGWPMSVFLTPDGVPFYAGTYFPAEDRLGIPAFKRVLLSVARAYREQRERIAEWRGELLTRLNQESALGGRTSPLTPASLDLAFQRLAPQVDTINGGFGRAPKFPQPMNLEFLLRYYLRSGQRRALELVDLTLTRMASGGIYDHLGGGFHRYATDARWLVPHFEKMLYDNAQLARLYLHAWQVTGRPLYRRVVEETLDYILRDMTDAAGGFFSAQDADSEGEEGKYYLWSMEEIYALLSPPLARAVCDYYGVTQKGNFEGRNILNVRRDLPTAAAAATQQVDEFRSILELGRRTLFEARQKRAKPGLDDKVLTAWNGLALAALAEAGRVLGRPDYVRAATRNAEFVLSQLRQGERLLRSWKRNATGDGGQAGLNGYLEDYACYADGLLALYQATFDPRWFHEACALADAMLTHFVDPNGGFFDTSHDHETLIVRPRQLQDNAMPCGGSMATHTLLQLAAYTSSDAYRRPAEAALSMMVPLMEQHPSAFGHWLNALAFDLAPPLEIALIGVPDAPDTLALLQVVFETYRPYQVVALAPPDAEALSAVPLLKGRAQLNARATAYVCRGFVCQVPTTDPRALADQLKQG